MLHHHILVKWKERPRDAGALNEDIRRIFEGALTVPGVHRAEVIPNAVDRPNRYDLMIRLTMEESALPRYDDCAAHHQWKDTYGDLIAQKAIFDSQA